MIEPKKKLFQIRNQRHRVIGTYTQQEIVDRIAAGKYTGTEEVSIEPHLQWQKLSSHPAFYDAFLKRLFIQEYQPPKSAAVDASRAEKISNHSQSRSYFVPTLEKPEDPAEERERGQVTQQLATAQHGEAQALNQEKEIEKLFLESPEAEVGEDSLEVEALFSEEEKAEQNLRIEESEGDEGHQTTHDELEEVSQSQEIPIPEKNWPKNKKNPRVIAAAVGLGLGFLYLMGQSPEPNETALINKKSDGSVKVLVEKNSVGKLNKEELILALSEEALHFYDADTPLHYSGSLALFTEAHQLSPSDISILAWLVLSQTHAIERNPNDPKALEEIKGLISKGREKEPQLSAFYRAEAIMEYYLKNFDAALEKIKYAREADPNEVEAAILEAEFLNATGDRTLAAEKIDKVISNSSEKVRAYFVASQIALDLGLLDKAEQSAKRALLINPMHANTHYLLAETYLRKGNRAAAVAHLDLVTKLAPLASRSVLADAHFALGKLLEEQGNSNDSMKHNKLAYYYSKGSLPGLSSKVSGVSGERSLKELAEEQQYGIAFYNARAEEFLNEGQLILGLEYLQVARLLQPTNPESLVRVAELLEKLAISYEKLKRVEILYRRAMYHDPKFLESYLKLAAIENEQYNFGKAYELLSQAGMLVGLEDIDSFVVRGCRDKISSASDAKDEYKIYLALAKHFFKRESFVCAAAFLKEARSASPANSEIYYYFGRLTELYKLDASVEAAAYYYQAYSIDSNNYEALAAWAKLKTRLGEKNYVIKYVRALLAVEPNNANLLWVLGETYSENQEYLRAITFFKKAIDNNNRFSKARISLARALSAVGQTYQAINEYTFAATTDRRNGVGFFEAAQLYTINKKYQEAELLVKALIESIPNYPGSHRLLSEVYQFTGKKDEAIAEMVLESKNSPQNTKFTLELAEIYMKYEKYQSAIDVLQKITNLPGEKTAPEFRADRTQAFLLMSRCYRQLSRPDNAEGSIRLALDIDNNDPELHRELGYVYHALQRYREGVKEFEVYLQRNPAGSDVENIKKLIKSMAIEE